MGTKQVTIRFCDCCDKEIIGRLTLHTCPCCGKDICVECQEKEDARHKPREKKQRVEPVVASLVEVKPEPKASKKRVPKTPISNNLLNSPDISTFSVSIGQNDEVHTFAGDSRE